MREALLQAGLESIVGGVGDGVLRENVRDHGNTIRRATVSGQRIAERRGVGSSANQGNRRAASGSGYGASGWSVSDRARNVRTARRRRRSIRQMEGHARRKGESIRAVREKRSACKRRVVYAGIGCNSLQVEACIRISWIEILGGEQPMPLTPYVCHGQHQVLRNFSLNRQVVLFSVLCTRILCGLTEEQNRTEHGPIHRLCARRVQDAVERIGKGRLSVLT